MVYTNFETKLLRHSSGLLILCFLMDWNFYKSCYFFNFYLNDVDFLDASSTSLSLSLSHPYTWTSGYIN